MATPHPRLKPQEYAEGPQAANAFEKAMKSALRVPKAKILELEKKKHQKESYK